MALQSPPDNWKKIPLGKDERLWSMIIILMILVMGIWTVAWVGLGSQNPPEEYYKVDPLEWRQTAKTGNSIPEITVVTLTNGEPALYRESGGDIYLTAMQWNWLFETNENSTQGVQLKMGETYRIHISSIDVLHGFQLLGGDFIISIQIVPGYAYIVDFIPNDVGQFMIVCNEYCMTGHHDMVGFLEVVA
ncbi:MAG: hypothetical protein OEZ01_11025 [Candidatus Heimdallarchaeota archaeon]|nr:hypothetical protein [Candidatus Heimdallarchaeota archaeon]MDH5646534.1 hypothetical protein [Candidatus Heimdallarchaeota archaeon]